MKINLNYLLSLEHCESSTDINYSMIPCTQIDMTDEGYTLFNNILKFVHSLNLSRIQRTRSGGISLTGCLKYRPRYDVRDLNSMIELTLILKEGCWRIQFRNSLDRIGEEQGISGRHAFWKFSDICLKHGIDIQDYRERDVEVAKENKLSIEPYLKKVLSNIYLDKSLENVHHLDLNSSFMASLADTFTEFKPIANELYNNRKLYPIYKGVMTNTIGYFQSDYHKFAWAHLSKAAINGNNKRIRNLIEELKLNNRIPILINTDGIWYAGDVYHPEDGTEGANLGQWKTDHTNCTILIKSPACYQYIENGKVHTVMSGRTKLDRIKKREDWDWGDIYHKDVKIIAYKLVNEMVELREI